MTPLTGSVWDHEGKPFSEFDRSLTKGKTFKTKTNTVNFTLHLDH